MNRTCSFLMTRTRQFIVMSTIIGFQVLACYASEPFDMGAARFLFRGSPHSNLFQIKENDQQLIQKLKMWDQESLMAYRDQCQPEERHDLRKRLFDLGNVFCHDLRHGWRLLDKSPQSLAKAQDLIGVRVVDCLFDQYDFYRVSANGVRLLSLALWENQSFESRWQEGILHQSLTLFTTFGQTYKEIQTFLRNHASSSSRFGFNPDASRAEFSATLSQHIALLAMILRAYKALGEGSAIASLREIRVE